MRILALLSLLLLLSFSASAENESGLTDLFSSGDLEIMPPELGEDIPSESTAQALSPEGMEDTVPIKALTGADEQKEAVSFLVKDVSTKETIQNAHIRISAHGPGEGLETLRFVSDEGKLDLQLARGEWDIELMLDLTSTSGKDYYTRFDLTVSGSLNRTVFLQPVGSLMGEVYDSENRLVPGAIVKFDCSGSYGIMTNVETDPFGSFHADWLPPGSCKVSALSDGKAGSTNVQISKGNLAEVRINLSQKVLGAPNILIWFLVLIFLALALGAYLLKHKKPLRIAEKGVHEALEPDARMRDLISAMDENEQKILDVLLREGGRYRQNRLTRELGMPKSSLSRALSGLEARNIVKTEKMGRVKEIELSSWFLNGKEGK